MHLLLWLGEFVFALLLISVRADEAEPGQGLEKYSIEGKIIPPEISSSQWLTSTRILVNGGDHMAFLRHDGSFTVNNLEPGSYIVEVCNANYVYEPARIDITMKGKLRARKVNFLQNNHVHQIPYPLKMKARGPYKYFQVRETWRITDFLFSPMVLMMVLPLLLIYMVPKLMNAADPETQKELQQMQLPKYDMPELSEMMTSLFTGGKKGGGKQKTTNKRQKIQ